MFSWLVMAILLGLGVVALPALVNGVAYLAGAERFAVLILFAIYKTVRQWRRHRQQAGSGLAIG